MTTLSITNLSGSPVSSVQFGSAVALTASVTTGGSPLPLGRVRFCETTTAICPGGGFIGTATLNAAGTATLRTHLAPGTHTIKAFLVPYGSMTASVSNAMTVTVSGNGAQATTTSAAATGTPSATTFTATVVGAYASYPNLTGSVSFVDTTLSNYSLGTATGVAAQQIAALGPKASYSAQAGTSAIVAADMNGDGVLDLIEGYSATAQSSDSGFRLRLGNGDGTFQATGTNIGTPNGVGAIAVADVNGDGVLDVVVSQPGALWVYLGNGDGTFRQPVMTTLPSFGVSGVAPTVTKLVTGDFDGDGYTDIAVWYGSTISVVYGSSRGTFVRPVQINDQSPIQDIAAGNFSGDGTSALAVIYQSGTTVNYYFPTSFGFQISTTSNTVGSNTKNIVVADVNGDGIADVIVTGDQVVTLLGQGNGQFTYDASKVYSPGMTVVATRVVDFNHDGIPDVLTLSTGAIAIALGDGSGAFAAPTQIALQPGVDQPKLSSFVTGDWDGDGVPDLAMPNPLGDLIDVYQNQNKHVLTASLTVPVAGSGSHTITATYSGDSNWATSSGTTFATAGKIQPTMTLSTATPSSYYTDTVTYTATISPVTASGQTFAGKTVTFYYDSNNVLGTATFNSAGVATLQSQGVLAIGNHQVLAIFDGNSDPLFNTTSSNQVAVTVGGSSTNLSIMFKGASSTTADHSVPVTLVATVANGSTPITSGYVRFCDATNSLPCTGDQLLATVALVASGTATGTASYKFFPPIGNHTYVAVHDASSTSSASSSGSKTVAVSGPFFTYTSVVPTVVGASGTYTYAVKTQATTNRFVTQAPPTGTVKLYEGTTLLGTYTFGTGSAVVGWKTTQLLTEASYVRAIVTGDFNGDGMMDIVAGLDNGTLQTFLGNGDGTFTLSATTPTGFLKVKRMIAYDFNQDGNLDLLFTTGNEGGAINNPSSPPFGSLVVCTGAGDGTFSCGAASGDLGIPGALAMTDFDHDGIMDLVIGDDVYNRLYVVRGLGPGSYQRKSTLGTVDIPTDVKLADFDNDGILDLVVDVNSAAPAIYTNLGDFTFNATGNQLPSVGGASAGTQSRLAVADFMNAGYPQIIQSNGSYGAIVYTRTNGNWTAFSTSLGGPGEIAVTNFNGDAYLDFIPSPGPSPRDFIVYTGTAGTVFGPGRGTQEAVATNLTPSTETLVTAPLVGEAFPDLVFGGNTLRVLMSGSTNTNTLTTSSLSVTGAGNHTITAQYSGDANYLPSTTNVIVSGGQQTPTVTLTATPSTAQFLDTVSVVATVTVPQNGYAPTGSVIFYDNGSAVSGSVALSNGTASLSKSWQVGTHNLAVGYSGDTNYFGASGTATLVVNKIPITITFSNTTATYDGNPHPITVTTTPYSPSTVVTYNGSPTVPVNAGSYAVYATIDSSSETGSAYGTLTINPAPVTFTVSNTTKSYSGGVLAPTIVTSPAGVPYTITYTSGGTQTPMNVGTYDFTVTPSSANFTGTAAGTLTINATPSTITWNIPASIYASDNLGRYMPPSANTAGTFVYTILQKATGNVFQVFPYTLLVPGDYEITTGLTATSANYSYTTLTKLLTVLPMNLFVVSSTGTVSSYFPSGVGQSSAVSGGGIGVGIDATGGVWSINNSGNTVERFSNAGVLLGSYSGGGLRDGRTLAIDGSGLVWIANGNGTITALTSAGVPALTTAVAGAGSLGTPTSISVNAAGSLWISNGADNSVTEVIGAATPVTATAVQQTINGTPGTRP